MKYRYYAQCVAILVWMSIANSYEGHSRELTQYPKFETKELYKTRRIINDNDVRVRKEPIILLGNIEGKVYEGDTVVVHGQSTFYEEVEGMQSRWLQITRERINEKVWIYGSYVNLAEGDNKNERSVITVDDSKYYRIPKQVLDEEGVKAIIALHEAGKDKNPKVLGMVLDSMSNSRQYKEVKYRLRGEVIIPYELNQNLPMKYLSSSRNYHKHPMRWRQFYYKEHTILVLLEWYWKRERGDPAKLKIPAGGSWSNYMNYYIIDYVVMKTEYPLNDLEIADSKDKEPAFIDEKENRSIVNEIYDKEIYYYNYALYPMFLYVVPYYAPDGESLEEEIIRERKKASGALRLGNILHVYGCNLSKKKLVKVKFHKAERIFIPTV